MLTDESTTNTFTERHNALSRSKFAETKNSDIKFSVIITQNIRSASFFKQKILRCNNAENTLLFHSSARADLLYDLRMQVGYLFGTDCTLTFEHSCKLTSYTSTAIIFVKYLLLPKSKKVKMKRNAEK